MNPLLMEDILDDLFKKLTIKDLKTCRSVCQLWDKRSVAHMKLFWKKLHIIDLIKYDPKTFNRAMCDSKNKKLFRSFEGFVNLISKLGTKFFSEHEPKHLHLHISSNEGEFKHEDLVNILRLSAKSLEQISFDGAVTCSGINNMDTWKGIDFTFPNLETIRYYMLQTSTNAQSCVEMNQILKEIIENSPNLKSIENPGMNFTINSSEIMSSNMLKNLTKMTMSFRKYTARFQNYQDCQDLLKIQNQGLKLKYLDIKYKIDNHRGEIEIEKRTIQSDLWAIEEFIQGQSGSLETLMIKVKCDYQIEFRAVFSKLKKLAMGIFHSSFQTRLDLSSQFPQLEVIFLNTYCKKIVKWKKLFCGSGLKVHAIQLRNDNYRSKYDGEYRDIEKLFPHVVNLQIGPLGKKSLKYKGFGKFWSKSIKTISIIDQTIDYDKKFFKIFSGLKRINFIKTDGTMFSDSKHWIRDIELLENFENLKFVKFRNLLVNQYDLTELGKKYIVDYIPARKFKNYEYLNSYSDDLDWQN